MVIYDLECAAGHRFEGWFPSPDSFTEQQGRGMIHCSICGIDAVRRIPAGGHVGNRPTVALKPTPPQSSKELTANVDPVTLVKMVDHYIRKNFKNVGSEFAKKAIAMHEGLEKEEPIYGTATPADKELLETKEVPFSSLPKLPESIDN